MVLGWAIYGIWFDPSYVQGKHINSYFVFNALIVGTLTFISD